MPKSGLTEADKEWIAGLIKPINDRLDVIEQDIKEIKSCPTIKKELLYLENNQDNADLNLQPQQQFQSSANSNNDYL